MGSQAVKLGGQHPALQGREPCLLLCSRSMQPASRLLARTECSKGGNLLPLAGGRVTSRGIRELEQRVMAVAARAAGREGPGEAPVAADRETGLQAAERALGEDRRLDREQRSALELLCSSAGWVCLTGRAGTGKGPTLHAAAEAYRNGGWQVLAVAMDGTTARRMAERLGGFAPALTVEQLKVRAAAGALALDARTVIFVDEASKLDSGHWGEITSLVEQHGVRVRAVGHDGQHEAIKLPGLFSEMLRGERIPAAELRQIRRHRDPANPARMHPWLRDYQVAVDQGRSADAVALLQEHDALKLYDTRAQAMGGMVEEWDSWRDRSDPGQSALIVHGPNSDVDLVNELAQQRRLEAGELGTQAVPAIDRNYLLRPGDLVAIRDAAYRFPPRSDGPRPKRVENGQIAVIDAVDPEKDAVRLLVREPGAEPRLVEIDQRGCGRAAAGKRAAPCGWRTRCTASRHGRNRARHRHARRPLVPSQARDLRRRHPRHLPAHRPRRPRGPRRRRDRRGPHRPLRTADRREPPAAREHPLRARPAAPAPARPLRPGADPQPGQRAVAHHAAAGEGLDRPLAGIRRPNSARDVASGRDEPSAASQPASPPDWLLQQLWPRPQERIARERWEREAGRLQALEGGRSHPAPSGQWPAKPTSPPPTRPSGPSPPRQPSPPKPGGPTIGR